MLEGENEFGEIIQNQVSEKRQYFFQLDVLKAIAIAFVVMDHSLTWEIKGLLGSVFWERLSIPFFLIVMGFNTGISFRYRNAKSLRELYSVDYFKRKLKRYVLPFIVLWFVSLYIGLALGYIDTSGYLWLGYLPFWGPGNWFIPLLFGSILVFPFIYWLFEKSPIFTIVVCFLSELIFQYILWFLYPAATTAYDWFVITAIRVNVLFFLPAIGIGLWLSGGYNIESKRNWFVYPYLAISVFFMFDYATGILSSHSSLLGQMMSIAQEFIRGDYTLFFYGYATFLVIIVLYMVPKTATGVFQKFIQRIGRSTYHILLFQIAWMSLVYWAVSPDAVIVPHIPDFALILGWPSPMFYIPFYLLNLFVSFTGGMLWYELERQLLYRKSP